MERPGRDIRVGLVLSGGGARGFAHIGVLRSLERAGAQFDVVAPLRLQAFTEPPYPNWTAVGVNWLAGFDFEIKVIARIPAISLPIRRAAP